MVAKSVNTSRNFSKHPSVRHWKYNGFSFCLPEFERFKPSLDQTPLPVSCPRSVAVPRAQRSWGRPRAPIREWLQWPTWGRDMSFYVELGHLGLRWKGKITSRQGCSSLDKRVAAVFPSNHHYFCTWGRAEGYFN